VVRRFGLLGWTAKELAWALRALGLALERDEPEDHLSSHPKSRHVRVCPQLHPRRVAPTLSGQYRLSF
jgi:hypothetical protein